MEAFEGSQKLELGTQIYFIEPTLCSLADLLKRKKKIRDKLEMGELCKLIQDMCSTLAYLESKNCPYPFLASANVYVCPEGYKLIPPHLVCE